MTIAGVWERGVNLATHTSLLICGPADYFVQIASEGDLVGAIRVAREHEVPVFVLGGGTNLLVADDGIRGVVLQNGLRETAVVGTTIEASSGTELAHVAAVAAHAAILGLEWMATVPGTVGGAGHGNAGAFGTETADVLVDADLMDLNGDTWLAPAVELGYAYRTSKLQGTPTVCVRARFRGTAGDRATAVRRIKEMANERMKKQPLAQPNTGSIFRNPPGDHAGRLIEAAGLQREKGGGAMGSEEARKLIRKTGDASADALRAP